MPEKNIKYAGNVFAPRFTTALTSTTLNQPLWLNLNCPPPPVFSSHSTFPQYQVGKWLWLPPTQESDAPGTLGHPLNAIPNHWSYRVRIDTTIFIVIIQSHHARTRPRTHTCTCMHLCVLMYSHTCIPCMHTGPWEPSWNGMRSPTQRDSEEFVAGFEILLTKLIYAEKM